MFTSEFLNVQTFLSTAVKNQNIHNEIYVALNLCPVHSIGFVRTVD